MTRRGKIKTFDSTVAELLEMLLRSHKHGNRLAHLHASDLASKLGLPHSAVAWTTTPAGKKRLGRFSGDGRVEQSQRWRDLVIYARVRELLAQDETLMAALGQVTSELHSDSGEEEVAFSTMRDAYYRGKEVWEDVAKKMLPLPPRK
jgi:hypothetical protein